MANYHNKKDTKTIGERLKNYRISKGWNIEDVAAMTGFSRSTISKIELGFNTDLSHFIEISKAIGVQPSEVLNFPLDLKPRYKLEGNRKHKTNLTNKLLFLIESTTLLSSPHDVSQVQQLLKEQFKIESSNVQVSVILRRFVSNGRLRSQKRGKKNHYSAVAKRI